MQRIINDPDYVVDDMIKGLLKANAGLLAPTENPKVVKYDKAPVANKVGVVNGGGSGHKPAFVGYVGRNMVDACAIGEVFSSPTAKSFYDAFKAADAGRGVACLYGNYAGDNMNVKMAVKMAKKDGIEVKTVVANDDVSSAPKDQSEKRRGVAGEVFMWKIGGAMAARGASLDEVIRVSQKAIDNCKSVGIGLTSCTIPAVGHPNFTIEDGMMEVGIGHHGEPGIEVTKLKSADEMAEQMFRIVSEDLPFQKGDEVAVLVSGLGATPLMELYILYNKLSELIANSGMTVYGTYIGNYFTSLEMMGVTLTMMKLDDELKALLSDEAECMGLVQFNKNV